MPALVTPNRRTGEIFILAVPGAGSLGRPRYWTPDLARNKGRQLTAYYDPEDLKAPVTVFSPDGRLACIAEHIGDVAFNDTAAGKEHARNKRRYIKAAKAAARAEQRMTSLEAAALSPRREGVEPPEPGVIVPNFGQGLKVVNGEVVDVAPAGNGPDSAWMSDSLDDMAYQQGLEYFEQTRTDRKDRHGRGRDE